MQAVLGPLLRGGATQANPPSHLHSLWTGSHQQDSVSRTIWEDCRHHPVTPESLRDRGPCHHGVLVTKVSHATANMDGGYSIIILLAEPII